MLEYNTTCLVGGSNILVDLKYNQDNPAEVTFVFHINGDSINWVFSRDLVRQVIREKESGQGDVLFYDHDDVISMVMKSDEGHGHALFGREIIKEFVDDVYSIVPEDEVLFTDSDLDDFLNGLL